MGKVSVAEIKELMKSTGVGMMDCKKALEENDGDMDKAIEFLREKGLATQAKKSSRAAAEGVVTAVVKGETGVLLEVNTETDFAANTDDIRNFVANVANTIIEDQRKHRYPSFRKTRGQACFLYPQWRKHRRSRKDGYRSCC